MRFNVFRLKTLYTLKYRRITAHYSINDFKISFIPKSSSSQIERGSNPTHAVSTFHFLLIFSVLSDSVYYFYQKNH